MDTPIDDEIQSLTTDDEISHALEIAMQSSTSLVAAVLQMLDKYDFAVSTLQRVIENQGLSLTFSCATFRSIAPVLGLDPDASLRDVAISNGYRARIPDALFASIIDDIQVGINNYGLPGDQESLKTSSFLVSMVCLNLS